MARTGIQVRPVLASSWDDFAALFSAKGCPHYCWCTVYREPQNYDMTPTQKRAAMRSRIQAGTPVGVLAYEGEEVVGWCSVAPRETYVRLGRSRTIPRVTSEPTWTILCFFLVRRLRGQGVAKALLKGAVDYARRSGGRVVEAYPFDTAGISSTHRGHSSFFAASGFRRDGSRWWKRLRPSRTARITPAQPRRRSSCAG